MSEFKTISEAADALNVPQHVLRFWESQFSQIKPAKRRGGRRFYSPQDMEVLQKIQNLLYVKGYTIKGAKKALNQGFMSIATPDLPKAEMAPKPIPGQAADNTRLRSILSNLKHAQQLLDQHNTVLQLQI